MLKGSQVHNLNKVSGNKQHYVLLNDVQIRTPPSFIAERMAVGWQLRKVLNLRKKQQTKHVTTDSPNSADYSAF